MAARCLGSGGNRRRDARRSSRRGSNREVAPAARAGSGMNRRALPNLLLGGLVGTIVALATLPADFVRGAGAIWPRPVYDLNAYVVGWRYFIGDQWRFPLFKVPG